MTFLRVHSNSKEVSYLSWQNTYPNLKTTCHVKLTFFSWTKLLQNLTPCKISHICHCAFKHKNNCLSKKTSKKSKNFEIQCMLCYCRCIALHFRLLQLVCVTYQWSTFYKTRMSCLSEQYILSSAINKKERETWKVKCGSSKWKVHYIVYEKNMGITLRVCWCQNKLFHVMAVLAMIYMFLRF